MRLLMVLLLVLFGHLTFAEIVDPRNPEELGRNATGSPINFSRFSWIRLRQLETEKARIENIIQGLPQHKPQTLKSQFGYHSNFDSASTNDHKLTVQIAKSGLIHAIALVPVLDPDGTGTSSYAFPRRFKIEGIAEGSEQAVELVNWMDQDFPDPGSYPVYFSDIDQRLKTIVITVPATTESPFFAIEELFIFRMMGRNNTLANVVPWTGTKVAVSDTFSMENQWDARFLEDQTTHLGYPLLDNREEVNDLLVVSEGTGGLGDTVILDFKITEKKPQKIERIDLWSASSPYGLTIPGFGFPKTIDAMLSTEQDFSNAWKPFSGDIRKRGASGRYVSIRMRGQRAKYMRLTLRGLHRFNEKTALGLGEIRVSGVDDDLVPIESIDATGLGELYMEQLPRLLDGKVGGHAILSEEEWIKGLASRRPYDQRLASVNHELSLTRSELQRLQIQLIWWGAIATCLLLLGIMILQRLQRHRILRNLRGRITRDLHDEVGSSLGSISMIAEELEESAENEFVREELGNLSMMALEAGSSLREVVWLMDRKSVLLPELFEKLAERAERLLGSIDLVVRAPDTCPNIEVSLTVKRHIMMFFKEVVHNCAKYAEADQFSVTYSFGGGFLHLTLEDDGRGFDMSKPTSGWGLNNMKRRAEELGGNVIIQSEINGGTRIELAIPLEMLSKEPTLPYATSN